MTTNEPIRYRKKPVVIEAMQWTGDNAEALAQWAGPLFSVVMPEDAISDPEVTAEIYDRLHSTWVGVKTNDYIIKGVVGEFYPCNGDVFHSTYELAELAKGGIVASGAVTLTELRRGG